MAIKIKNEVWYYEKYGKLGHVLIPEFIIQQRVLTLSTKITRKYKTDENLVIIIVSEGANVFATDLLRNLSISGFHPETFTIAVKSYIKTNKKKKINWVNISSFRPTKLKDKNILIVEDIIDTGETIKFLYNLFGDKTCNPKDITICSLLDKQIKRELPNNINLEFIGFEIPDVFVIGYGLDYNNKYRNLPFISVYTKNEIK